MTLQALSESNRRLWLEAMDGKEPVSISSCLSVKYLFCSCWGGLGGVLLCVFNCLSDKAIVLLTDLSLAPSSDSLWYKKCDRALWGFGGGGIFGTIFVPDLFYMFKM